VKSCGSRSSRAREGLSEQAELTVATDQRRTGLLLHVDSEAGPGLNRFPDGDRPRFPLRLNRLGVGVLDPLLGGPKRLLADEDPVDGRRRLQTRRRVHYVARRHGLPSLGPRAHRDKGLTSVDADPHLDSLVTGPVVDRECSPDCALRIILMRNRSAEDRHHCVADELLHSPAEPLQLSAHMPLIALKLGRHVLRIHLLGTRGGADEIGEEDGDNLPLPASRRHGRSLDEPSPEPWIRFRQDWAVRSSDEGSVCPRNR